MAILSIADRMAVWREFMADKRHRRLGDSFAVSKADIRAAVDALDQYLEDNAAAMNQAIPQPARSGLTARQKAMILMAVAARRYGVL